MNTSERPSTKRYPRAMPWSKNVGVIILLTFSGCDLSSLRTSFVYRGLTEVKKFLPALLDLTNRANVNEIQVKLLVSVTFHMTSF